MGLSPFHTHLIKDDGQFLAALVGISFEGDFYRINSFETM